MTSIFNRPTRGYVWDTLNGILQRYSNTARHCKCMHLICKQTDICANYCAHCPTQPLTEYAFIFADGGLQCYYKFEKWLK